MMLKQAFVLAILSHSAFCRFAPNERQLEADADQGTGGPWGPLSPEWIYCEDECTKACQNCTDHCVCDLRTEKYCGLSHECQKAPNGLELCDCPRDEVCVPKHCFCPVTPDCPVVCRVDCDLDTGIVCPGEGDGDCPGQETCEPRPRCTDGSWGPGFCLQECNETAIPCKPYCDPTCEVCCDNIYQPICQPKQLDCHGCYCPDEYQWCKKTCKEDEHYCCGCQDWNCCYQEDSCVKREECRSCPDGLCPGICPVCCKEGEVKCHGPIDYKPNGEQCPGQDTCVICAKDCEGNCCPDDSDSHGCPINCRPDEVLCPGKPCADGCKTPACCRKRSCDINGNWCPMHSDCPCHCPDGYTCCPGGEDELGCKKADICVVKHLDYQGAECPFHCPKPCDECEVFCPGKLDTNTGCYAPDKCIPKEKHQWGDHEGEYCPGWCPVQCNDCEVLCPSLIDPCNGCPTEEVCRQAITDVNGKFCPGKEFVQHIDGKEFERDPTHSGRDGAGRRGGYLSASHNCPHYCDEKNGEALCPVYEDIHGCKPEALCIERKPCITPNPDGSPNYCPCDCPKECPPGKKLCRYPDSQTDTDGCHFQDICVDISRHVVTKELCPQTWCPILCKKSGLPWELIWRQMLVNGCPAKPECRGPEAEEEGYIIEGEAIEAQ